MWNIGPIQIQAILYIHINIYRTYSQKMELVEGTKGGGERRKERANNHEIHHICVGTRHNETLKTVKQYRIEGKGQGSAVEGSYIALGTMHIQV
jgi:hypothetical protein